MIGASKASMVDWGDSAWFGDAGLYIVRSVVAGTKAEGVNQAGHERFCMSG